MGTPATGKAAFHSPYEANPTLLAFWCSPRLEPLTGPKHILPVNDPPAFVLRPHRIEKSRRGTELQTGPRNENIQPF